MIILDSPKFGICFAIPNNSLAVQALSTALEATCDYKISEFSLHTVDDSITELLALDYINVTIKHNQPDDKYNPLNQNQTDTANSTFFLKAGQTLALHPNADVTITKGPKIIAKHISLTIRDPFTNNLLLQIKKIVKSFIGYQKMSLVEK